MTACAGSSGGGFLWAVTVIAFSSEASPAGAPATGGGVVGADGGAETGVSIAGVGGAAGGSVGAAASSCVAASGATAGAANGAEFSTPGGVPASVSAKEMREALNNLDLFVTHETKPNPGSPVCAALLTQNAKINANAFRSPSGYLSGHPVARRQPVAKPLNPGQAR